MSQQIKAVMSYQTDFIITLIATMIKQVLGIIFLSVMFQKIPHIHGWTYWEVAFIYGIVILNEGISGFFFNGVWVIGGLVNKGEMDRILVRPVSPLLQVFTSTLGLGGTGSILIGILIVVQAIHHLQLEWTIFKIAMFILLTLSAVVIRVSILLAACSQTFWTGSTNTSFAHTVHTLSEFSRFPVTIYNLGVQALITIVVPYAFISFYPAAYLYGKEPWGAYGLLSLVVALYTACLAYWIFRRGLRRYESTGN
ncbi:ABC transporter permease [Paenibacillus sp. HJGM_3]